MDKGNKFPRTEAGNAKDTGDNTGTPEFEAWRNRLKKDLGRGPYGKPKMHRALGETAAEGVIEDPGEAPPDDSPQPDSLSSR